MSKPPVTSGGPLRALRTRTQRLVAVCGKCGVKLGGGFGEGNKRSLTKALKRSEAIGKGKRAPVKVVETRCLGICPKHAVALIASHRPGTVVIVPWGTPIDEIVAQIAADDPPPQPTGSFG